MLEMRLVEQNGTSYLGDNYLKGDIAPQKLTKIFCVLPSFWSPI